MRLMLDLAVNNTGECISIKSIAARQGISEKYLEQIIGQLNRAGYVRSVRGAQGGYLLAKDPAEYTVGMILRLMEGNLLVVGCLDEDAAACERAEHCVTQEVWHQMQEAISGIVDNITLADLVTRYNERAEPMYII